MLNQLLRRVVVVIRAWFNALRWINRPRLRVAWGGHTSNIVIHDSKHCVYGHGNVNLNRVWKVERNTCFVCTHDVSPWFGGV